MCSGPQKTRALSQGHVALESVLLVTMSKVVPGGRGRRELTGHLRSQENGERGECLPVFGTWLGAGPGLGMKVPTSFCLFEHMMNASGGAEPLSAFVILFFREALFFR